MDRLALLERLQHSDYQDRPLLITPEKIQNMMVKYSAVRLSDPNYINQANKKSLNLKFINIVDPTFSKNNLGKSISKLNSSRIKQGLKLHLKKLT
jgi:hypothetical protein